MLVICLVLSLSSWCQQPLGNTYVLVCQNEVKVSDSFVFRKTKSCRQHTVFMMRLTLMTQ